MQRRLFGIPGWLLLLAAALLSSLPAAADPSPFEAVVARVGRGASAGCGVLISREGLLVTASAAVDSRGRGRVVLGGTEFAGSPVKVPGVPDLALLAIPPPKGGEFHTVAMGVASRLASGARVQVVGPAGAVGAGDGDSIAAVETLVRDIEMDHSTGAHYLRLDLSFVSALAGAPVFDAEDQKLVALIVPDPTGRPGCRALTVDSLKEAIFDAGRAIRPLIAPGLKGGDVPAAGPVGPDGILNRSQVLEWSFPTRSGSEVQSLERMLSAQAWREITGFQLPPLTALRQHEDGACYLASLTGVLYAIDPKKQSLVWSYEANEEAVVLHAPAVADDNVYLATGNLGLLAQKRASTGRPGYFVIDLFGRRYKTSLALNQGSIHAVDRRTGRLKWIYETSLVGEPQVLGSSVCFGGLGVYGALDAGTGKESWIHRDENRTREANWYCLKAGKDGNLYGLVVPVRLEGSGARRDPLRLVGDGEIRAVAIDAASGATRWSTRLFEPEGSSRRPLAAVVLVDADGTLHAFCGREVFVLDPGGPVRTRFTLKGAALSERVAVSDGRVFLAGDDNSVHALSGADGSRLWTFSQPRAPVVAPVVQDGVVYVGSFDSNLYAVDEKTGLLTWRFEGDRRIGGVPLVRDGEVLCASEEGRIWRILLPRQAP